jgi:hypothetical protein
MVAPRILGSARRRKGFALLVTLWVMVSATVLALAGAMIGRESFRAGRNRVNAERALWWAEGCLARARAVIDTRLASATAPDVASAVWRALDTTVIHDPLVAGAPGCSVGLEAAGSRVDLNGPAEPIVRALTALYGAAQAVPLADALFDWRDTDSVAAPAGAEASWYVGQGRRTPRDDSLAHVLELARVRGFERLGGLDSVFDVESGRISIANAPAVVLAAVPGLTHETVVRILDWRARGVQVVDLLDLLGAVSRPSGDSLFARFPDIARLATLEPDAWIVRGTGTAGLPAAEVRVELRLVRSQDRAIVVRRRVWP